jgi:hypothetical protein
VIWARASALRLKSPQIRRASVDLLSLIEYSVSIRSVQTLFESFAWISLNSVNKKEIEQESVNKRGRSEYKGVNCYADPAHRLDGRFAISPRDYIRVAGEGLRYRV